MESILIFVLPNDLIKYIIRKYTTYLKHFEILDMEYPVNGQSIIYKSYRIKSVISNIIPKNAKNIISNYYKSHSKSWKICTIMNMLYDSNNGLLYISVMLRDTNRIINYIYDLSDNEILQIFNIGINNFIPFGGQNIIGSNVIYVSKYSFYDPNNLKKIHIEFKEDYFLRKYVNAKNKVIRTKLSIDKHSPGYIYVDMSNVYICDKTAEHIHIYSLDDNEYKTVKTNINLDDREILCIKLWITDEYIYLQVLNITAVYSRDTLTKINEYKSLVYSQFVKHDITIKDDFMYVLKDRYIKIYNAITFEKLGKINMNFQTKELNLSNDIIFCTNDDRTKIAMLY